MLMQSKFRYFALSFYLILLSCSTVTTHNSMFESFETITDGKNPDGWVTNNLNLKKDASELSVDNSVSHNGKKSIMISISNLHKPTSTIYNWIKRVDGIQAGITYEFTGWIKTENIKYSPFLEIQFWNNTKMIGLVNSKKDFSVISTKNWEPFKKIVFVPQGTDRILLKTAVQSRGNEGGRVWFDDILIKKAE